MLSFGTATHRDDRVALCCPRPVGAGAREATSVGFRASAVCLPKRADRAPSGRGVALIDWEDRPLTLVIYVLALLLPGTGRRRLPAGPRHRNGGMAWTV